MQIKLNFMKGFVRGVGLSLKHRHKVTRKWLVTCRLRGKTSPSESLLVLVLLFQLSVVKSKLKKTLQPITKHTDNTLNQSKLEASTRN